MAASKKKGGKKIDFKCSSVTLSRKLYVSLQECSPRSWNVGVVVRQNPPFHCDTTALIDKCTLFIYKVVEIKKNPKANKPITYKA